MTYSNFGELIKEQRKIKEGTIYDVGKLAGVSNTYISQIENGKKLPSKKVLFLIVHFLGIHTGVDNNFQDEALKIYSEYKRINFDELKEEFDTYITDYIHQFMQPLNDLSNDISNNRIQAEKGTLEVERIDKPYFDLNWLLTQKDYEVLYHRDYDIQNTNRRRKDMDIMEKLLYNRLSDVDIKTIRELIEAYISNKYYRFPDKKGD